ncbi:hypothetical protein KFL_001100330 [Klebsormidium nitens]|uniref:Uncharacterized protein n=1 Tax=Klebsormidium nitens TaxID=105231 RepID=A0A1Y1HZ00_KLENI|nr:hypothetical protein KFL_001100330 [Klebsormidium nitens]|eukprot:GAQ82419.1 hypothetical protein KFL_001100330 [Klebsormidium nitens]
MKRSARKKRFTRGETSQRSRVLRAASRGQSCRATCHAAAPKAQGFANRTSEDGSGKENGPNKGKAKKGALSENLAFGMNTSEGQAPEQSLRMQKSGTAKDALLPLPVGHSVPVPVEIPPALKAEAPGLVRDVTAPDADVSTTARDATPTLTSSPPKQTFSHGRRTCFRPSTCENFGGASLRSPVKAPEGEKRIGRTEEPSRRNEGVRKRKPKQKLSLSPKERYIGIMENVQEPCPHTVRKLKEEGKSDDLEQPLLVWTQTTFLQTAGCRTSTEPERGRELRNQSCGPGALQRIARAQARRGGAESKGATQLGNGEWLVPR